MAVTIQDRGKTMSAFEGDNHFHNLKDKAMRSKTFYNNDKINIGEGLGIGMKSSMYSTQSSRAKANKMYFLRHT